MPIVFSHSDSLKDLQLAVWDHAADSVPVDPSTILDGEELRHYHSFKSSSRKAEYLTVRRLLREMGISGSRIEYDANGRPTLSDGGFISISHSGTKVALIVSYTRQVGIDLETTRLNISAIAQKFVSDEEFRWLGKQLDDATLHIIWCAKEILFKLYAKGNVDFRKDLKFEGLADNGTAAASIHKPDFTATVSVDYRQLEGCVLAWAAL